MSNINQLAVASIPVHNAQVPAEGPVALVLSLDFTVATEYDLDIYALVARDFISLIQTVFIDTTGCAQNLTVNIAGSNQNITVKPNTQGYYPVVCPNPPKFRITCTGGQPNNVGIIFLNVPIAPGQWDTV